MQSCLLAPLFSIYNNKRLLLLFIFLISIFISSIFLLLLKNIGPSQHGIPPGDYFHLYKPIANSILKGEGIVVGEELITDVPPGYPIILSIIFGPSYLFGIDELKLIVVFNMIITAAACCLLFFIGKLLFNKKIGLIASFLWMSYPFNLWFIKNPHTEVPFIFLLYLGICLFILAFKKINWKYVFLAGLVLGFASLIRPTVLPLPFLLALLIIFFSKDTLKRSKYFLASILLIGNLLAILPWELHVFFQTGDIIPVSTLGPISTKRGLTFALEPGMAGDRVVVPSDVEALMKRADAKNFNTGTTIFYFCLEELISRPIPFLKLLGLKAARAWYATSNNWYENKILAVQILYLITAFLGIIYGIKLYRNKIRNIILLLSIVLCFWAVTISGQSLLRYMIPAMGFCILFSAILINFVITRLIKKFAHSPYNK